MEKDVGLFQELENSWNRLQMMGNTDEKKLDKKSVGEEDLILYSRTESKPCDRNYLPAHQSIVLASLENLFSASAKKWNKNEWNI